MHQAENTKHHRPQAGHEIQHRAKWPFKLDRKLTDEEINSLEQVVYDGPITVVRTHREMLNAVTELRKEKLLGFDTEKRPSFSKGVFYPPALLQLGGHDTVYLFQLTHLKLSHELTGILANPGIIKAGVAIGRDIKELRELTEFQPAGFVDLGICAANCGIQHHGLRGLSAILLGCRISKRAKLTNWSKSTLPDYALQYAATDAWIGRRIYKAMEKHGCFQRQVHTSPAGGHKEPQLEFPFSACSS